MITNLKQYCANERNSISVLHPIPKNFYVLLKSEMQHLDKKEFILIKDLLNDFIRMRHSKIIQFASVMKSRNTLIDNMSDEEAQLFLSIQNNTNLFRKEVQICLNSPK